MASPVAQIITPLAPTSIVTTIAPTVTQSVDILPSPTTLLQAARLAIQQDKPIQLDYFVETVTGKAFIGEDPETKDKVLVKSRDEFTSLISKMYKVGDDFLIMTENSLYIVSGKIQKRKVNMASLIGDNM